MSTQNSEFTKKLRAAVKAKLEEFGLEVDEELPDYVMIMVGNKKDKVRMKADLKLFLGDNTSPFVDWLFDFFQKVKSVTSSGGAGNSSKISDSQKDDMTDSKHNKRRKPSISTELPSLSQKESHTHRSLIADSSHHDELKSSQKTSSRKTIVTTLSTEKKLKKEEKRTSSKKHENVVAKKETTKSYKEGEKERRIVSSKVASQPIKKSGLTKKVVSREKPEKVDTHTVKLSSKKSDAREEKVNESTSHRELKRNISKDETISKNSRLTHSSLMREVNNDRLENDENDYDDDIVPQRTVKSKVVVQDEEESPKRKVSSKVVVMRRVNENNSQLNRGSSNIFKRAISDAASFSAGYGAVSVSNNVRPARQSRDIHIDYNNKDELEPVAPKKRRSIDEKLPRLVITVNSSPVANNPTRIISRPQKQANIGSEIGSNEESKGEIIVRSKDQKENGDEVDSVVTTGKRLRRLPPKSALLEAVRKAAANAAAAVRVTPPRKRILNALKTDNVELENGERENRPASPPVKTARRRIVYDESENNTEVKIADTKLTKQRPPVLPPDGVAAKRTRRQNRILLNELGDDELAGAVAKAMKCATNASENEEDDDEAAIDLMLAQLKRRKRNRSLARTLLRLSGLSPKMIRVLKAALVEGDLDDEYDPSDDNNLFEKFKQERGDKTDDRHINEGSEGWKKSSSSSVPATPLWDGQINLELSSSDDEAEIDALLASTNEEVRAAEAHNILHPTELPPPTAALSRPSALRTTASVDKDTFSTLGYNPAQYQASFTPPIGRPAENIFVSAFTTNSNGLPGNVPHSPVVQSATVSTHSTSSVVPVVQTKTAERCRFWPDCRNEDVCPFHHPSKPCTTFPNCWFGEKCLFVHPPCKFGMHCLKPKCTFTHYKTVPSSVASVPSKAAPSHGNFKQKYGGASTTVPAAPVTTSTVNASTSNTVVSGETAVTTASSDTIPAVSVVATTITDSVAPSIPLAASDTASLPTNTIACRYGGRCQNLRCTYKHPPSCRFGVNCFNTNCYFLHRKPTVTVLPALSKCYNTSGGTPTVIASTATATETNTITTTTAVSFSDSPVIAVTSVVKESVSAEATMSATVMTNAAATC